MTMRALWLSLIAALLITTAAASADASPPLSVDVPGDMNVHAVVSTGLAGIDLQNHSVAVGAFPAGGLGIGIDFFASKPYAAGVAVAAMGSAATSESNWAKVAFLASFARYYYGGVLWSLEAGASRWYATAGIDVLRVATGQ
jgi:hypothetical protein